jgi:hypothetical protein
MTCCWRIVISPTIPQDSPLATILRYAIWGFFSSISLLVRHQNSATADSHTCNIFLLISNVLSILARHRTSIWMIGARTPVSKICFDASASRNELTSANTELESSLVNASHESARERNLWLAKMSSQARSLETSNIQLEVQWREPNEDWACNIETGILQLDGILAYQTGYKQPWVLNKRRLRNCLSERGLVWRARADSNTRASGP